MKRSKIIGSIIFWLLTAAVMYIIFSFSSENGEQSKEVSEGVLSIIIEYLGNIVSHNVLRKIAHFTEYAALGFCMSGAICFTFSKNKSILCRCKKNSSEFNDGFIIKSPFMV